VAGSFIDPGAENMCIGIERGGYKDVHMLVQQGFIARMRGLWSGLWGLKFVTEVMMTRILESCCQWSHLAF
jgi:hypothetical protein